LINPDIVFGFLRNNTDNPAIHWIAVLVRLAVGTLLIIQARQSRFPLTIEVLGWVFVIAGIALALIGSTRFRRLLSWVLANLVAFGRIAGIVAIVFGGFIVFAFL